MQLTMHHLNGRNYLEWSQSVKLAIHGKGKIRIFDRRNQGAEGRRVWLHAMAFRELPRHSMLLNSMVYLNYQASNVYENGQGGLELCL